MSGFQLAGLTDLERRLLMLDRMMRDLRPFWPRVRTLFIGWMRAQFESEGSFAGHPWQQLSPAYAAWKSIRYPGKGILQATGDLRKAASLPRSVARPTWLELWVEESGAHHKPVLAYHQEGTDRMPARPLLFGEPIPAAARTELDALVAEYANEMVTRLGLAGMKF